ncbi:MAG TPA: alpha/beta hydrolase [Solirubrobacterales bacterium]
MLSHERVGEGEPLIAIMGMSGTRRAWGETFRAELARSFDCVFFDNRGMGDSPEAGMPFSVADMAGDTIDLLDELGIERAHAFGVSMGGAIAQELALAHPERVRTLTLGATFCGGPEAQLMDPADLQMLGAAYATGEREPVYRAMWEINLSPGFRSDDSRFAAFKAMGDESRVPRAVVMQQMRACAEHDASERLSGISAPTLVVHGTVDRLIKVENGLQVAAGIPTRIELLEDVGHIFWWEQPERSADLIREHALTAAA